MNFWRELCASTRGFIAMTLGRTTALSLSAPDDSCIRPSTMPVRTESVDSNGRGTGFEHRSSPPPPDDIVYLCSNKSTTSVTAAQIREISGAEGGSERTFQARVKRGWNRLNADKQAAVVTRYSNGETSTALADEYGVAKSTILRILREARVVVRRQPMTPEQVSEAAQLYEAGLSLSQVAKRLDVNQETTRTAILKAGAVLREPTKRKTA